MKTVWIAGVALAFSATALAQTTIYKLVDQEGRVTYSNRPMKGAMIVDLDPLTVIPTSPQVVSEKSNIAVYPEQPTAAPAPRADPSAPVAKVMPIPAALASIDVQTQKRRDDGRRRILEDELQKEQESLDAVRASLQKEQQNPELVAAVRVAQNTPNPTPAQLKQFHENIDKASGRIRGLQATAAEHEKNIEALKKELGALKP